jgi:hypothetical protein
MKVAIEVTPDIEHTTQVVKGKGIFAKDQTVPGPDRIAGYFLTVKVAFTEEEKSIISRYHLHDVVLFDEPLLSAEGLERERADYAKLFSARERREHPEFVNEHVEFFRNQRHEFHVGDFADYNQRFDTAYEVYRHIDYLKSQILPAIKNLLVSFNERQPTEVFEL